MKNIDLSVNSILKFLGSGDALEKAYNSIIEVISNIEWKIKEKEESILGIEHAGMHMTLKKFIQYDKINLENGNKTFGEALLKNLDNDLVSKLCIIYYHNFN